MEMVARIKMNAEGGRWRVMVAREASTQLHDINTIGSITVHHDLFLRMIPYVNFLPERPTICFNGSILGLCGQGTFEGFFPETEFSPETR
jgi:hypothetical protein